MSEKEASQVASDFCSSVLWTDALWIATTYRFHPESEAPPIMGLVFANWVNGVNLFRTWPQEYNNIDPYDDLRVAVIEGDIPKQKAGYSIRISAEQSDWQQTQRISPSPCQLQRMHPLKDNPDMLQTFKQEYLKHGEFLLAPVVQRDDDQFYFNVHAGIVKRECVFREVSEIGENEPDAIIFELPAQVAIIPAESAGD